MWKKLLSNQMHTTWPDFEPLHTQTQSKILLPILPSEERHICSGYKRE